MQLKFVCLFSVSVLSFSSVQSQDICNFTISVSQKLLRNGFHRNLTYSIDFENHSMPKRNKPVYFYDGCILGVQQMLPAGIYVDPDELEDLRRNEKLSAFPHNGMNIEVAAPYARPFNAYIFSLVKFSKVETFLPVHARYQSPAVGGGMANNTIKSPSAYLRCSDHRLDECEMPITINTYLCDKEPLPEERCSWKQVVVTISKNSNDTLIWEVPIGDLSHFYFVEIVTLLTVLYGSLSLMKRIHEHKMSFKLTRVT